MYRFDKACEKILLKTACIPHSTMSNLTQKIHKRPKIAGIARSILISHGNPRETRYFIPQSGSRTRKINKPARGRGSDHFFRGESRISHREDDSRGESSPKGEVTVRSSGRDKARDARPPSNGGCGEP